MAARWAPASFHCRSQSSHLLAPIGPTAIVAAKLPAVVRGTVPLQEQRSAIGSITYARHAYFSVSPKGPSVFSSVLPAERISRSASERAYVSNRAKLPPNACRISKPASAHKSSKPRRSARCFRKGVLLNPGFTVSPFSTEMQPHTPIEWKWEFLNDCRSKETGLYR